MEKSISYKDILNKELSKIKEAGITPRLLLHSCCAPCSSYCLEYLSDYFKITVFFYNPNISPESEYAHRVSEEKRLISSLAVKNKIDFIEGEFNPSDFYDAVKGFEDVKEGG